MKLRDRFATINGDNTVIDMPHGVEIVADDGKTLFSIELHKDGMLHISGGDYCEHFGKKLSGTISVIPVVSNVIYVKKDEFIPYIEADEKEDELFDDIKC